MERLASEGHVSSVNALKQAPDLETSKFTASNTCHVYIFLFGLVKNCLLT